MSAWRVSSLFPLLQQIEAIKSIQVLEQSNGNTNSRNWLHIVSHSSNYCKKIKIGRTNCAVFILDRRLGADIAWHHIFAIMFLFSAHQTYLNTKLSKERPSLGRQHITTLAEGNNLISTVISRNLTSATTNQQNSSLMNKPMGIDLSKRNRFMHTEIICNHQERQSNNNLTERMQRTKKYFSSDGHKFLFNNT